MFLGHILNSRINCANYAPVIFNGVWEEGAGGRGHIVLLLSIHMSHQYVQKMVSVQYLLK